MDKHEYEETNTITKEDIARLGDSSIFVGMTCGIIRQRIEDDGKDIRCYLLTCETMEETFDYVTYRVYAEQVAEIRDGEPFYLGKEC